VLSYNDTQSREPKSSPGNQTEQNSSSSMDPPDQCKVVLENKFKQKKIPSSKQIKKNKAKQNLERSILHPTFAAELE
jgi:hypothetical protein